MISGYQHNETLPPSLNARYDGRSDEYLAWREQRLQLAQRGQNTTIDLPLELFTRNAEYACATDVLVKAIAALCARVRTHGFAVYRFFNHEPRQDYPSVLSLAQAQTVANRLSHMLGLRGVDDGVIRDSGSMSLLRDMSGTARGRFIPYTSKAMNWHTDGYYNSPDSTLRCFTLHCVHPASDGGALTVLDPELLLIAMQEEHPDLIAELTHRDAMLLPANTDNQGHDRPDRAAPVFFVHSDGALGMRFTTRTENIRWRSSNTEKAAKQVADMINTSEHWHSRIRLQSGEGVVTRNILHRRQAFSEQPGSPGRQVLRGRYLQLPDGTGVTHAAR